jgi:hypothetical protein
MKEKLHLNRRFAKGFKVVAEKPEYKESYGRLVDFSDFVRLNGIKLSRDYYFQNVFVDLIKFVIYLEKCIIRSVIVFYLLSRPYLGSFSWDQPLG